MSGSRPCIPAPSIVVVIWWLVGGATDRWITIHSGPINAWFIARFGWDDVSWLFAGDRASSRRGSDGWSRRCWRCR